MAAPRRHADEGRAKQDRDASRADEPPRTTASRMARGSVERHPDRASDATTPQAPAQAAEATPAAAGGSNQEAEPLAVPADASASSVGDATSSQATSADPVETKDDLAGDGTQQPGPDGSGLVQTASPQPISLPGAAGVPMMGQGASAAAESRASDASGQAAPVQGAAAAGVTDSAAVDAAVAAGSARGAGSDKVPGPDASSLGPPSADETQGSFAADLSAFAPSAAAAGHGSAAPGAAGQSAAPASNAATSGPATPPVPLGAVPVEIGLRSLQGATRFEVRLDPAELGRIDVRLDIDDEGKVKAHLTVERVETLNLLQRDARSLERAFEQAGLKPSEGGIDYALRDQGSGRGGHGQPGGRTSAGDGAPAARDDTPPALPPERLLRRGAAGIDLRI